MHAGAPLEEHALEAAMHGEFHGAAQLDHRTRIMPHLGMIGGAENGKLRGKVDTACLVDHWPFALEKLKTLLGACPHAKACEPSQTRR